MPNILIVDDDDTLRDIYKRFLDAEGFQIFEAADAGEALVDRGVAMDLILLDIQMPGMHGGPLMPELKKLHPAAKIVVCSCHHPNVQKEIISNAEGYFDKTEGCNALLSQIRSLLTHPHVS